MKPIYKALGLATVVAFSFFSCDENDGISSANTKATPAPGTYSANFLLVNAIADGGSLDFYVNGAKAGASVSNSTGQTGYTSVPLTTAGLNSIANTSLRAKATAGAIGGKLGSNDLIYRAGNTNVNNLVASNGSRYTLIALDSINRPAPIRKFSLDPKTQAPVADLTYQNKLNGQQITKDEFTALLPANQSNYVSIGVIPTGISDPGGARFYLLTDTYPTDAAIATAVTNNQSFIRFVHASPNAPGVFVRLVPTSSGSTINLVTSAAQYVMSVAGGFNPSVGSRSATAGFTTTSTGSAATTYNVEIHSNSGFTALVLSVPNVSFTPGKIYTIVAKGLLGKTGASGLAAVIVTHN